MSVIEIDLSIAVISVIISVRLWRRKKRLCPEKGLLEGKADGKK